MTSPALIKNGNGRTYATAYFIEDANGDLVDIEYKCSWCSNDEGDWWPSYQWPDYTVVCACGEVINYEQEPDATD